MTTRKYPFPDFLANQCTPDAYRRWLHRKAAAHRKRDRARGNAEAMIEAYKRAIHAAVLHSHGLDDYTGQPLRWDLISKYDNEASKAGKRFYKQSFGDLPSVDHVGSGIGEPGFKICAWRTNDAKNDLPYDEFVALCRRVIDHHARSSTP
jgi:hypothetical protein